MTFDVFIYNETMNMFSAMINPKSKTIQKMSLKYLAWTGLFESIFVHQHDFILNFTTKLLQLASLNIR